MTFIQWILELLTEVPHLIEIHILVVWSTVCLPCK